MGLRTTHNNLIILCKEALDVNNYTDYLMNEYVVGDRTQTTSNESLSIRQTSFEYEEFAGGGQRHTYYVDLHCYSNTYTKAAKMADYLYEYFRDWSGEVISGDIQITPYDMILRENPQDGYESIVSVIYTELSLPS